MHQPIVAMNDLRMFTDDNLGECACDFRVGKRRGIDSLRILEQPSSRPMNKTAKAVNANSFRLL
jgi:hypothetical protein